MTSLLEQDVFTPDVIEGWLDYKRGRDIDPIKLTPHPIEFLMYFDV